MRILTTSAFLILGGSAAFAQAQSPKLVEAKRQCWEQVGIYGDPNKTRGAYIHMDVVTACVRQKMGTGGSQDKRRG